MKTLLIPLFLITLLWSCNSSHEKPTTQTEEPEKNTSIEMITDYGTMIIELYNETPLHRDNFIKLAKEGAFDSLLFHRVIEKFMIQTGDPDSKHAMPGDTLGEGDLPYMVDAEMLPTLFHKKGALGAARDGNLKRASSAMQFYIVQGKIFPDSLIDKSEARINQWLSEHYFKNDPTNKEFTDQLEGAEGDDLILLSDSLTNMAKEYTQFEKYSIPEEHREVYRTIGGTPHLDQNYTVFGQVIQGLNVIDSIAAIQTDELDRPLEDLRIQSIRVIE